MAKKKKLFIWLVIILAVVGGGFFYFKSEKPAVQYTTEKVSRGTIAQTVSVTGELVSEEELNLNFEITGRIKEIKTAVGKKVAVGEPIALIDDAVLAQDLEKAKVALDKAVADAGANNDKVREAEQLVKNAENALDAAKDLEKQKIEAAEEIYENKSDYYNNALSYYNQIVEESGVASSTAKSAKLTLTTAENEKKAANDAIETAKKSQAVEVTTQENALNSAKEQLKTAQSKYAKESRDATVETAQINYETAETNLEKSSLRAPVNGTITALNYKKGEVLGSSASNPFGKMISSDLILESNVPESDIVKVKAGQNASVTFDSLSEDEKFDAQVIEIEPAATVIQDVVYYKVKFKMKDVDQRLKSGMSADIDIHVAERQNALMIPQRAVKNEDGKQIVQVLLPDKTVEKREIKTGLKGDEGMIEVVSGLKEGNEVVTLEKTN